MKLLITGGAGYIGSHVARLGLEHGHEIEIVDDLSSGQKARVDCPIHQVNLADSSAVEYLSGILGQGFDAVIHLAAKKQVGESVQNPELYFQENLGGLANLLLAIRNSKTRKFIFSSSAAAYGMPDVEEVRESDIPNPINPYGQTKLIGEWMVKNAEVWGLLHVSLRYFNVAGTGFAGLHDTAALNLIPIVIRQIKNNEQPVVFGADYPTPDGTCIRDYIHVLDLASAHLEAIRYLDNPAANHRVFNIGTSQGSSVLDVMNQIRQVSGINFQPEIAPRRAGDPARLVANAELAKKVLGFRAEFGLAEIIKSAWS